jgi:AraC family transcriptional regulator of adaptative response / DNA-3-methyladenine glycosylase II
MRAAMSDSRQCSRRLGARMGGMLDDDRCYGAMQGRDPRFDGWFVVAVRTTHIYCRPSCPARTPRRENVTFYPTAAAAQAVGYRACRRCRPDAAPGSPGWRGSADVAARAMQLVLDGVVDREGVGGLARRLGYSERQLQRLLVAELGAPAAVLARAQRAQTARVLLDSSDLPVSSVAFAAGFSSIRQFNDTIRHVFACTPSDLRRAGRRRRTSPAAHSTAGGTASKAAGAAQGVEIRLRLAYRAPLAAGELLGFLAARCVPGLEEVDGSTYRRTLVLPHGEGRVALTTAADHVGASFVISDLRDLSSAVARCRHVLNLDADPVAIDDALAADPLLAPLVAARPGVRVPGCVDGFEIAVRAVLGQQVSLAQARSWVHRLVTACGRRSTLAGSPPGGVNAAGPDALGLLFPGPQQLAELLAGQPEVLGGMPATRRAAVAELAAAAGSGRLDLDAGADPEEVRRRLLECRGVGPWTAEYVAMRAIGDPDAFLPGDAGSRRAAARLGLPADPGEMARRAGAWRPWRAHAQLHLWAVDAAPLSTAVSARAPIEEGSAA